jgi:hypothetical protein
MSKTKKATEVIGLLSAIFTACAMGLRLRREIHASVREALDTEAMGLDDQFVKDAVERARKGTD